MEKDYLLEQLENMYNELLAKKTDIQHQMEIIEKVIKELEGK